MAVNLERNMINKGVNEGIKGTYFIKGLIRMIPKGNNIPNIGQGLVKASVGLRVFNAKGGIVTNNMRNGAELTTSLRVIMRGRHCRKTKEKLLSYLHFSHSLIS